MYMSPEEIQAVQNGQLRAYLAQFAKDDTESNADSRPNYNQELDNDPFNSSPNNQKPQQFVSVGLNGEKIVSAKRKYVPQGAHNLSLEDYIYSDEETINAELHANVIYDKGQGPKKTQYGVCQLDFDDFFELMMLKIRY